MIKRKYNLKLNLSSILRVYFASALAALPLILLKLHNSQNIALSLAIGGLAYLAAYLTILPLTKALSKTDVENLSAVAERAKTLNKLATFILKYEAKLLKMMAENSPE